MASPAAITAIRPRPNDSHHGVIEVNGKAVATLSHRSIAQLGLVPGMTWDDALAQRVAEAVEYEKALRQASKWIDRRALSRAQVASKLAAAGCGGERAERVLARMAELTLIDDEKLGRALIEELLAKRPAGPALLRDKLLRRGFEESLVERLVAEACESDTTSSVDGAVELAGRKLATMSGLDPATRQRQLWGLLARRGFDEETIRRVLERLGEE